MSITSIVTGGAHASESGGKNGKAGDQKQNGKPDYSGEVSMRSLNETQFRSKYTGYTLWRLINVGQASDAADLMIRACNNPNIGYSQDSRQQIFQYGVDSGTAINCDCSSLVCYCLTQATAKSFNTNTTGLTSAIPQSGLFMSPIAATSVNFATNPPCNGDVLLKGGAHVEMVVSGNPRDGKESEITAGTWVGDGNALQSYSNQFGTTYTFAPRKSAPTPGNIYYDHDFGETPNGQYAWGRFTEIMRSPCSLSRGVAKKWYVYSEDGYKRGTAPLPGAVMCWTNVYDNNNAGAVAIVEEVNPNSISISWKHPTTANFEYKQLMKTNGTWDLDLDNDGKYEYHCQGFIYNPAVDAETSVAPSSSSFIKTAKNQVGDTGAFVQKYTDVVPKRDPWAAAFIVAVAKATGGLLDIVIPNTYACSNIGRLGVNRDMGTWFDGPALGGNPTPHSGDIILIRTTALSRPDDYRYGADKAGIVYKVGKADKSKTGKGETSSRTVEVVMGDVADRVRLVTYSTNSGQISGYFRPNWDKTDGYTREVKEMIEDDGLYTEGTSMDDAALRDLRYVEITESGLQPSIKSSGITLSAINYTGMLANFYTAFVESGTCPGYDGDTMRTGGYTDADGNVVIPAGYATGIGEIAMTPEVQEVYEMLTRGIGSSAAAIGILGNIYQESRFNTSAIGDSGTSGGLCQWHAGRFTNMVNFINNNYGGNWGTNLKGQVQFLLSELSGTALMGKLRNVNDSTEGAQQAADMFTREFERPKNAAQRSAERQAYSNQFWSLIRGG